jgi:hypothetical protein
VSKSFRQYSRMKGSKNLSEKISCYDLAYIFTSLCPLPLAGENFR